MVTRRANRLTEVLRRIEHDLGVPPRYCFGESGEYEVRVAASEDDRRRAWGLAYRVYRRKEYAPLDTSGLWYGLHDVLPETTTFLAEREGRAVAALTVVFDSPLGLPAEDLYRREMDRLRAAGRRPCELVSLVSAVPVLRRGAEVTRHLFKLAYLTARRLEAADDFVITVNPRHVRFYERVLLFERLGGERDYGKVGGAPAVLLRLDLVTAERRYRLRYGEGGDSFYSFFVNPVSERRILRMLRRARNVLGESALRRLFVEDRRLLERASPAARAHILDCYPFYDLIPETADTGVHPPI